MQAIWRQETRHWVSDSHRTSHFFWFV